MQSPKEVNFPGIQSEYTLSHIAEKSYECNDCIKSSKLSLICFILQATKMPQNAERGQETRMLATKYPG